MSSVGVLLLTFAVWLIYCGGNSLRPIRTLLAIVKSPSDASAIIDGGKTAAKGSSATFSGGGSFDNSGQDSFPAPDIASGSDTPQGYAESQLSNWGWGSDQMTYLSELWQRESGWSVTAKNASSGAYGIPQALPASKMATAGSDYLTNYKTQINWGLQYIKQRYGTPQAAWSHEQIQGWY